MQYKRNNHIRWLRRENTNNLSYMCLLIEETAQREKKTVSLPSFFVIMMLDCLINLLDRLINPRSIESNFVIGEIAR